MNTNKKSSSGNLFALLTGLVAGAAAVFFSKKENREKARETIKKAEKEIGKAAAEVQKNPKAKKLIKKVRTEGKKIAQKAERKMVAAEKMVETKVKKSPVLRAVGKK